MSSEPRTLSGKMKKDLECTREAIIGLKKYWKERGYEVEYEIVFNEKLKTYGIKSDNFVKGLPKGELSDSVKRTLVL